MTRDTSQSAPARLKGLDAVRGIAALAVLFQHAGVFPIGWMGVDLFFALSGFLITGILLDGKRAAETRGAVLRPFYARRALRIFPLGFAMLAAMLFVLPAIQPELRVPFAAQLKYWLYLSNWRTGGSVGATLYLRHFWSLGVEEQFYLCWPLVVLACSPRTLQRVCLGAVAGSTTARIALLASPASRIFAVPMLTPCRLEGLALGALLAIVARDPTGLAPYRSSFRNGLVVSVGVIGLILIIEGPGDSGGLMMTGGLLFVAIASASIVGLAALGDLRRISWPWLTWVGTISYGLYVYHAPIAIVAGQHIASAPIRPVLVLAASLLIAAASWYGFERPVLSLKARFPMPRASSTRIRRRPQLAPIHT